MRLFKPYNLPFPGTNSPSSDTSTQLFSARDTNLHLFSAISHIFLANITSAPPKLPLLSLYFCRRKIYCDSTDKFIQIEHILSFKKWMQILKNVKARGRHENRTGCAVKSHKKMSVFSSRVGKNASSIVSVKGMCLWDIQWDAYAYEVILKIRWSKFWLNKTLTFFCRL